MVGVSIKNSLVERHAEGLVTEALGDTRVVLVNGAPGIAGAIILGLGRALGETMAVALAAGSSPVLTADPTHPIQTMTAYIVSTAKGDAATGSIKYQSLFAVGVTLFAFTLTMNLLAQRLVRKFRQVYA